MYCNAHYVLGASRDEAVYNPCPKELTEASSNDMDKFTEHLLWAMPRVTIFTCINSPVFTIKLPCEASTIISPTLQKRLELREVEQLI